MQSQKLRLDRSRHAAPQVFDHLRRQIISLELAPGAPLIAGGQDSASSERTTTLVLVTAQVEEGY